MATATKMKDMIAVGTTKTKIPILGFITWFTVPDQSISLTKLKRTLAMNGLDPASLPKSSRPVHTFQRSCRSVEGKHRNGTVTEIKVDEVNETQTDCVYQITRLVRDLAERVIEHPKAMRVTFEKSTEKITFDPLGGVPRGDLLELMEGIQDFYDQNSSKVTGPKVRSLVRSYLNGDLMATNLKGRSGSIYFVPFPGKETLDAIADTLEELYKDKAYLHTIPMADAIGEREIVRRHHVEGCIDEIDEALAATTRLVKSQDTRDRNIRSNVVAHHWTKLQEVSKKITAYNEILEDEQDDLELKLDILKDQLRKLEDAAAL